MMGKNMAPAAVLEMNSVMKVPTKQIAVMTTMGLEPQTSRMPKARRSAMPVFWMATPSTTEPANTISISQLIAFMAWSTLQHLNRSIAIAARKAHCSRGMTLRAESTTIRIIIVVEMSVLLPILGTWSESKKHRASFREEVLTLIFFGQRNSNVSPACSTTSLGAFLMRSPRRATAVNVRLFSFSNVLPPMVLPIRRLPKLT